MRFMMDCDHGTLPQEDEIEESSQDDPEKKQRQNVQKLNKTEQTKTEKAVIRKIGDANNGIFGVRKCSKKEYHGCSLIASYIILFGIIKDNDSRASFKSY